jgi:hypothetical protein
MGGDMTRGAGSARGARTGRDPSATFAGGTPLGTAGEPVARPPSVDPSAGVSAGNANLAPERLLTPVELADFLGCGRAYVYEHANELGAVRLGSGPRARLRFDLAIVLERLRACSPSRESESAQTRAAEPVSRWRPPARSGSGAPLLPVRPLRTQ